MRCFFAGLIGIVMTAMLLGGVVLMVVGATNVWEDHKAYQVGFKHSGDGCGAERVEIDVTSGEPLRCGPPGLRLPAGDGPTFPGFTPDQNDSVLSLADQLSDGGLSKDEQERVQRMVDSFAAGVPKQALHRPEWWGAKVFWLGLVTAACGAVSFVVVRRTAR
ncbi:hypothetical protein [Kribbella sp. DT2]|uniref:hypothetical protein n=1 Tax=Kribbella sp. DT2 TaxID=3393427 RepID=UPI003CF8558C